jgi:hypothetical protein
VLLAEKLETFQNSKIRDTILGWGAPGQQTITWTDDFASLWHILRFRSCGRSADLHPLQVKIRRTFPHSSEESS